MIGPKKTDLTSKRGTGRRRRKKSWKMPLLLVLFAFMAFLLVAWLYLTASFISSNPNNENSGPAAIVGENKGSLLRKKDNTNNRNQDVGKAIDQVLATLMNLADMPWHDLQELLEGDKSYNSPFQLDKLQDGICPYSTSQDLPKWLPPRVAAKPEKWFDRLDTQKEPIVAVYYEHLSKAGGTSFCTLAQSNMARRFVPNYYCMPSNGPKMPDARIGSWTGPQLEAYFKEKAHRLVSNEWEPLNVEFMSHFSDNPDVKLVFVTSIRNPINRLLSAHKFWGVLHNPNEKKPSLELWLQRVNQRAKRWKILNGDFMANVGRLNFATWKFSGGKIPITDLSFNAEKNLNIKADEDISRILTEKHLSKEEWKQPFETAVRMLSRFDLVIPMEELSKHPKPVTDTLGWKDFSQAHVVPSGKVMNNKGSSQLPPREYDLLWQANALDYILYYWSSAVYLTRLHCAQHIP